MVEGALLLAGARTIPSEAASLAVVAESSSVEKKRRGRRWRSREGGRWWRSSEGKVALAMGSWAPAIGLGTGAGGGIGDWRMETGAGGVRKGIRVCQPRDQRTWDGSVRDSLHLQDLYTPKTTFFPGQTRSRRTTLF
jgi:hypothetical protein